MELGWDLKSVGFQEVSGFVRRKNPFVGSLGGGGTKCYTPVAVSLFLESFSSSFLDGEHARNPFET